MLGHHRMTAERLNQGAILRIVTAPRDKPSQAWDQHEVAPGGIAYMKINVDKEQLISRNNATSSSSLPVTNLCVSARNKCGGGLNVHTSHSQ